MVDLTPDAVTFAWVNNGDPIKYYPERTSEFETLVAERDDRNTIVATSEAEARRHTKPATWKTITSGQLYIYERIPFTSVVESVSELQSELDRIMENPPNLNAEFMTVQTPDWTGEAPINYLDIRESVALAMFGEGIDQETVNNALHTVDEAVVNNEEKLQW